MEVEFYKEFPEEMKKEIEEKYRIKEGEAQLYDEEKAKNLLKEDVVKEIRIFKLKPGMRINIEGTKYKVISARKNGKITLREESNGRA